MTDIWTKEKRSSVMARIRSKDTKPELLVRSELHKQGLRYRLHRKNLPGKPDIVFVSKRLAIFVHGCFWHSHNDCIDGRVPKSNTMYWESKLKRNVERDVENRQKLKDQGWRTLVVWECEVEKNLSEVVKRIVKAKG